MKEESYVLTPKSILYNAMRNTGLLDGVTNGQFEACWILFEHDMKKFGYIEEP